MKSIAFFNHLAGVGTSTLVYHVAWFLARQRETVLVVDLDPQANLSRLFLSDEELADFWFEREHRRTIFGALRQVVRGEGDFLAAHVERIDQDLGLIVGDLALSGLEDRLSSAWFLNRGGPVALAALCAIHRVIQDAAKRWNADWVLLDVGPNFTAINRAALIASDFLVTPLVPDLFFLQNLQELGVNLENWRSAWQLCLDNHPSSDLPAGLFQALGYVLMHPHHRRSSARQDYRRQIESLPAIFHESMAQQEIPLAPWFKDRFQLASLRHLWSLAAMAREARKPVFSLLPADGALGAFGEAAQQAEIEFASLVAKLSAAARDRLA
jgi:chromosome partitioning protein